MKESNTTQSQCDQILKILQDGDSIDALKALEIIGSWGGFRARITLRGNLPGVFEGAGI